MRGIFFTGTDTGVGKTYVTAMVARWLGQRGHAVSVSKPVVTGAAWNGSRWIGDDTRLLAEAAGCDDLERVTPWALAEPAAPPVAARAAGVVFTLDDIVGAVRRSHVGGSVLLVEGVGGLLCPLTEEGTVADLAVRLGLPVVVVARRSLGTLNHTQLTLEAIQARKLPLAGVVINETEAVRGLAATSNVEELRRRGVPLLGVLSHGGSTSELEDIDWWKIAERAR